ncbi:MAG: helix-turn-helix transcriptional regulator [Paenibacillaceae bacterium]|nr:helix-turn-helix transcriptional regulator [Paenibacillaceae bacterium]
MTEQIRKAAPLPRLIICGDVFAAAGASLPYRELEDYELVYFPIGSRTVYEVGGKRIRIDRPGYIVTRPGEGHTYEFDPDVPTRHLFAHFVWDPIPPGEYTTLLAEAHYVPETSPLVIDLLQRIFQYGEAKAHRWETRCNKLLYVLLDELAALHELGTAEPGGHGKLLPEQLQRAYDYIGTHLYRSIRVSELCEHAGWTHAHFTRQVRHYFGETPQMLIMRLRIERAGELLPFGKWSVKQIAYAVGFDDEHYFSRCFRRIKGMTPSQFRDRYRHDRLHNIALPDEPPTGPRQHRVFRFPQPAEDAST